MGSLRAAIKEGLRRLSVTSANSGDDLYVRGHIGAERKLDVPVITERVGASAAFSEVLVKV